MAQRLPSKKKRKWGFGEQLASLLCHAFDIVQGFGLHTGGAHGGRHASNQAVFPKGSGCPWPLYPDNSRHHQQTKLRLCKGIRANEGYSMAPGSCGQEKLDFCI